MNIFLRSHWSFSRFSIASYLKTIRCFFTIFTVDTSGDRCPRNRDRNDSFERARADVDKTVVRNPEKTVGSDATARAVVPESYAAPLGTRNERTVFGRFVRPSRARRRRKRRKITNGAGPQFVLRSFNAPGLNARTDETFRKCATSRPRRTT